MADAQWAQSMGGLALAAERLSVLHLSQCRGGGDGTAALLVAGAAVIRWLQYLANQEYEDMAREGGGMSDGSAKNVPTMGGLLIVAAIDLSALMWAQWNPLVTLTLLSCWRCVCWVFMMTTRR